MSLHLQEGTAHPWASAREEWELKVLPRLEREGKAIGKAAYDGNKDALKVIEAYQLIYRSFDPMALELLKTALSAYDKSHAAPSSEQEKT